MRQTPPVRAQGLESRLSNTRGVPARWRSDLDCVLISQAQIARRVRSLAREIEGDYRTRDLVIVSLLNGTVMFLADLIRQVSIPLRLDFIGVSSYGAGTTSGELVFTGRTLKRVIQRLRPLKPRRLRTCVLLDKTSRRIEKVNADYVGFAIPDVFVVGYGLDYAERYRNLPFVGVLSDRLYTSLTTPQ